MHRPSVQASFIFSLPASLTRLIIRAGRSAADNLMLWQIAAIRRTVSGAGCRGRLRTDGRAWGSRGRPPHLRPVTVPSRRPRKGYAVPGPAPAARRGVNTAASAYRGGRRRAGLRRARSTQRGRAAARSGAEVGTGLRGAGAAARAPPRAAAAGSPAGAAGAVPRGAVLPSREGALLARVAAGGARALRAASGLREDRLWESGM